MSSRQRQQEKNKGSVDMKGSTFLPEWDVLPSFLLLLLLFNKMRNLSVWNIAVNQCICAQTSQVKTVKTLLYSHTWKIMHSPWAVLTVTYFRLHADVHREVCTDSCELSRTWVDDDFYITNTRANLCGCTDAESMNWPLLCMAEWEKQKHLNVYELLQMHSTIKIAKVVFFQGLSKGFSRFSHSADIQCMQ